MRAARGFTLIELMVASAIPRGVLAGGLMVTTQLQRRSVLETRTAVTQNALRALQDVVKVDVFVPGCPPDPEVIDYVLTELAAGRMPTLEGRTLQWN